MYRSWCSISFHQDIIQDKQNIFQLMKLKYFSEIHFLIVISISKWLTKAMKSKHKLLLYNKL